MKTKLETILVTGATGNVGGEVIKQLSSATPPVNIKAAVHSVENAKRVKDDGIQVVLIDYNNPETIRNAFKKVDKLFSLTHPSSKTTEHESNLVTEAKKSGIRHIVKQSII